ncbi:MAG TPA: hypothetical protein VF590_21640 [Isosphaeraceae bacterium]|jgi:hypothetical protein
MKNGHPYQEYEALKVWKVLSKGIKDLEANGDIEEKTARPHIVGYLSKLLHDSDLLVETTRHAIRPVADEIDS